MALILTSRVPWRRRPSGLVTVDLTSPLARGLVGQWPLNGTFRELLTGTYATSASAPGWTGSPLGGVAADFVAASSQTLNAGSNSAWDIASSFSISAWFYARASTGYKTILSHRNADTTGAYGLNLSTSAQQIQVYLRTTSFSTWQPTTTYALNAWNHVVAVFDDTANTFEVYLNGVSLGTTGVVTAPGGSSHSIRIGAIASTEYFNGSLADVALYNTALTFAEQWALYDPRTRFSLYAPLVHRVYFDIGGGSGPADLACDAGSYTLTGNAATLTKASALAPDAGSYTVAGNTTTLTVARILTCDAGSYTLTGNAVTLTKASVLLPDAGAYTLTGNDATLTYQQAGSLTCDVGTYTVTGFDTTLTVARLLTANTGDYTTTGLDVTFTVGTTLICDSGNYTVTGFDPTLLYIRALPATTGAYTVTGQAVTLLYSGAPVEDTDYSEYIFGQSSDPVSTLSIDLLPNDDGVSSLSISLGD